MSSNEIVDRGRQVSGPTTSGLRRVTVVTQIHHHADSGETVGVETYKSVECRTDDSPVKRTVTVGPAWQELDFGWVESPSLVVLVNEPTAWSAQPTSEQQCADKTRVLQVSLDDSPFTAVPPGHSFAFIPLPNKTYQVRCVAEATCRVTLLACPS